MRVRKELLEPPEPLVQPALLVRVEPQVQQEPQVPPVRMVMQRPYKWEQ